MFWRSRYHLAPTIANVMQYAPEWLGKLHIDHIFEKKGLLELTEE